LTLPKNAFVATQTNNRKPPAVAASTKSEPEMVIIRPPAQWTFFFHPAIVFHLVG
jgi:hypothetical protein